MIDSAAQRSARPSAEIAQSLSHVLGGFPGVFLPMPRLIYVVFLKSSRAHMAISHGSQTRPQPPFLAPRGAADPPGQLLAT